MDIQPQVTSFCSDYFFHHLLMSSQEVRTLLVSHLAHYPITYTQIENNEEYPINHDLKKMVLDVVLSDQFGHLYNIEMQNGVITRDVIVRFISYATKLLEREIKKGGNYNVHSVKSLIIYTGRPIRNLNHFTHHLEFMDSEYCIKIEEGPICIEIIQTQKMEELNMETKFNDPFYQFIYLFENEQNHQKEQKDPLCKNVVKLYEDYLNSEQLLAYYQHERDLRILNTQIYNAKNQGIQEGIEMGIEKGIEIGKQNGEQQKALDNCKKLISHIYHSDDTTWLNSCSLKQLDYIIEIIMNNYTYEEFKDMIFHYKEKDSQQ